MEPIEFDEQNKILIAENCGDLPVYVDEKQVISCWKLTEIEKAFLITRGEIWLRIMTSSKTQPPVNLSVENPFMRIENENT